MKKRKITVIGSGSWGSAIAFLLNNNGHDVTLWSFKEDEARSIIQYRENKEFLPGVHLSEKIYVTSDVEAAADCEVAVMVVPSAFCENVAKSFAPFLNKNQIIVNASKGIHQTALTTLSEVLEGIFPTCSVGVLAGPSHAEEVGRGLPTACVTAFREPEIAREIQDIFISNVFRVYAHTDIIGVELGGALKNVIALAAGICDGLGFGDNTKAALMTRGIVEISRLGEAMGADRQTFSGLTGIGDLIVTCTSMLSRNRRAGILIGQGKTLDEALKEVHMVVEGVVTAKSAHALAKKLGVEMPILEAVNSILFEGKKPADIVMKLMTRDRAFENL
ncbi:MAG: NAD(P)H-dependent glycerol-3-phosphate dehydrogenase [Defluviitaleaceae bacterium]|nr:NAD(P)H-dependent glycerol-3-phosphate dehydrogenase [Defluviitaleaceae bacterium]